ncbi:MAG TPA: arylsulfatase [Microbacterium sp.]|uniref:arylsulfatase n=1 Tax=Microbacterium sp. TaxID=51671 RepID=UPI002B473B3F|nr:arylsulfatase [Microbacterium sp.]HKT57280.1 arylsulfatase [Microbacterium sp.]
METGGTALPAGARGYERFGGRAAEFTSQSEPWWPAPARPSGAPNVVIMLIDDLGFSDLGPFGSEIPTPHIDALADRGWTFSNYHTAPMCSPSRASLLTGLNPHRAGFGYVAHVDPGYPGFACELPADAPTLAESLRAGGYATFAVGKWHLTIESKLHDGADKSSWPLQRGFDRYFGSMDGFTSLHHPHRLVSDNSPVDVREFPDGYFLTDELTERALGMIDDLRANDPEKPFFLYYAHTSVHGPIQAKAPDIDRHRGTYDAGWDALRRERFARQQASGLVSADAVLPADDLPDAAGIRRWDDLGADEKRLFARHMEVYAAAVDEIDQSIGRLTERLHELGELDDTIFLVMSDNGGTAEGGPSGTRSYFAQFGHDANVPADWVRDVPRDPELIGGPRVFGQYPAGWARVSNTPWRAFKSSTYEGGVHAPLVVSWPAAAARPGLRDQFVFVADVAPTILELAGIPPLASRDGMPALDVDGRSFADALADAAAPGRDAQYFECVGRRAYVEGGLKAVSTVRPTAEEGAAGGTWELYDLGADPTETVDLAASRSGDVARLASRWRDAAWANTVFPLDDTGALHTVRPESEAVLSEPVFLPAGRPVLERFRSAKLTVLRSFRVTAELTCGPDAAGVVVAHGDQGGGYLLAIEDGRLTLAYNAYGDMHRAAADAPIGAGPHRVELRLDEVDGLRWRVTASLDGRPAAVIDSVPMLLGMCPFTGISVGYDYGGPVDWELYERHRSFPFTGGELRGVTYVPGARSSHDETELRAMDDAIAAIAD